MAANQAVIVRSVQDVGDQSKAHKQNDAKRCSHVDNAGLHDDRTLSTC